MKDASRVVIVSPPVARRDDIFARIHSNWKARVSCCALWLTLAATFAGCGGEGGPDDASTDRGASMADRVAPLDVSSDDPALDRMPADAEDGSTPDGALPDDTAVTDAAPSDGVVGDADAATDDASDANRDDASMPPNDSAVDTPAVDTPAMDTPTMDTPAVDIPAMDTPAMDTPAMDTPAMDTSATDTLVPDAPVPDAPASDAPASDTPTDTAIADVASDTMTMLGGIGATCTSGAGCASGRCASSNIGCVYDAPDSMGWVRSAMGACATPATVAVPGGTMARASRSDGYCWVRFLNTSGVPVDPRTVAAYPRTCDTACQQSVTTLTGPVTGAVGRCQTIAYCTAPCRSIDECPTGSNWMCAASVGVEPTCTCRATSATEVACNGVDDNCDGVTDPTSAMCGGACVDLATSAANCGMCGLACRASEVCSNARCECPGVRGTYCSRVMACRDLDSDVNNCGGCGVTCSGTYANATVTCRGGVCGFTCNAGWGDCDGVTANGCEVNLTTSLTHCGMCNNTCPVYANATASCVAGVCGSTCTAPFRDCNMMTSDGCETNTSDNTASCGACGNACVAPVGGSVSCVASACRQTCAPVAGAVMAVCAGACVDLASDPNNCGYCGFVPTVACFPGAVCNRGSCACPTGLSLCGRTCVDTTTSSANCGTCGHVCPASTTCRGSTCVCPSGLTLCGTTCVDTTTSATNCGICGRTCAAGFVCSAGTCVSSCPAGTQYCSGACAPAGACTSTGTGGCAQTSTYVCSGTTSVCPAVPRTSGSCTSPVGGTCNASGVCVCGTGLTACTGTCRDLASDAAHCGSCTVACPTGDSCVSGGCVSPTAPPRLIAPLSLGDVTQRRPTLRWTLPSGYAGVEVQLCSDRACTRVIETLVATGTSIRPAADLPARSVVFWRARGRTAGRSDTAFSPVWLFHVPALSAVSGVDTSANPHFDANGDGYDDVVVGAQLADPGGRSAAGSASVFMGSASGLAASAARVVEGAAGGDTFGYTVACAGDVNGDGYADLIVGAHNADPGGRSGAGTASVFLGSATGIPATPARVLEGGASNDAFGRSVASAGDVNGDGYADVIVGAEAADPGGRSSAGTASVFLGSATGIGAMPATVLEGVAAGNTFGISVASIGDANGDGYSDVIVGANSASPGGRGGAGTASVFMGSTTGVSSTPARVLEGAAASDQLGYSVASAGDVNGDGYTDLLIGVPFADPGTVANTGAARIYHGSASGIGATVDRELQGVASDDGFGIRASSAGDVNGDGYADVIVGAYTADPGGRVNAGTASVFLGAPAGVSSTPLTVLQGVAAGDVFGVSVASAGDVNGDSYADVIVGAQYADPGGRGNAGTASAFMGSISGLSTSPARVYEGGAVSDMFGCAVADARSVLGGVRGALRAWLLPARARHPSRRRS